MNAQINFADWSNSSELFSVIQIPNGYGFFSKVTGLQIFGHEECDMKKEWRKFESVDAYMAHWRDKYASYDDTFLKLYEEFTTAN